MLVSMTGFGSATTRESGYLISSEIKSVNGRYIKTSIKLPDGFTSLEMKIDELLRSKVARGSVNLTLRITREASGSEYEVNFAVLRRYLSETLRFMRENADLSDVVTQGTIADYMRLPGVVHDSSNAEAENLPERLWEAIEQNLGTSLSALQKMRDVEGASTQRYLTGNIKELRDSIGEVKRLAPEVVENYRVQLTERVGKALEEEGLELDQSALIREIAVYTDRVDISEEIARFYSHLDQFEATMEHEKTCGKKLDFLTQEMFRETNTIGSKANSPDVLSFVVEMKSTIERIREMVQNVE